MKALLSQLALLLGGVCAVLSLAWNLYQRMNLLTAAFRAALVFFATVVVLFFFLRFFSVVLIRFVAERVMQYRAQNQKNASQAGAASGDRSTNAGDENASAL